MPRAILSLNNEIKKNFLSNEVIDFAHGFYEIKLQKTPELVSWAYDWALSDTDIQRLILKKHSIYKNKTLHRVG